MKVSRRIRGRTKDLGSRRNGNWTTPTEELEKRLSSSFKKVEVTATGWDVCDRQ